MKTHRATEPQTKTEDFAQSRQICEEIVSDADGFP